MLGLWFGLFQSIRPTIKYQPGKANIVVDTLEKSQRGVVQDSTKIEAQESSNEDAIYALSRVSIKPNLEDLPKRQQAYKDDPSFKIVYIKLRQGQPCGGQYLNPVGLLAMKKGGQHKIVVHKSLWQQIWKNATMCQLHYMWAFVGLWNLWAGNSIDED